MRAALTCAACALLLAGCSVKGFAIRQLGKTLASSSGGAFAAENDPEFAGQAVPFSLKLIESLLDAQPDDANLLMAAAAGFTQYAFVWVQQPADFREADDFAEAQRQRDRARNFYLRAHRYARRALEARYAGFAAGFDRDPKAAVAEVKAADVALLYWAAASLGSAISLSKTDPEMIARQPQIEALADRAYQLEPGWGAGALEEFFISYEPARVGISGGLARARRHFERAVELADGRRASPFVTFAEGVCVQEQNKAEFIALLERALAIDPDSAPENRLANVVIQQRARWLLGRLDELFLD